MDGRPMCCPFSSCSTKGVVYVSVLTCPESGPWLLPLGIAEQDGFFAPFEEKVAHIRHTCLTVVGSGLSFSSQDAVGRPLCADNPGLATWDIRSKMRRKGTEPPA